MDWNCSDNTYLENLYWVAIVAIKCVIATLAHGLRSTHLQIKFLEALIRCNFSADLPGTMILCMLMVYRDQVILVEMTNF